MWASGSVNSNESYARPSPALSSSPPQRDGRRGSVRDGVLETVNDTRTEKHDDQRSEPQLVWDIFWALR